MVSRVFLELVQKNMGRTWNIRKFEGRGKEIPVTAQSICNHDDWCIQNASHLET